MAISTFYLKRLASSNLEWRAATRPFAEGASRCGHQSADL